jgi:hypothetical protein
MIGYFALRPVTYLAQVDASGDRRAETFGREVLSEAPGGAILFARGDRAVFTLWYFHFALGERPDLILVAEDLLHFDWYQENLRATYPALILPDPPLFPETLTGANPSRPACYVRYSDHTEMKCATMHPNASRSGRVSILPTARSDETGERRGLRGEIVLGHGRRSRDALAR